MQPDGGLVVFFGDRDSALSIPCGRLVEVRFASKDGLAKAKPFDTKSTAIDDILFPKNYITEDNRRIWWPNPTVGYAYHMIAGTIKP